MVIKNSESLWNMKRLTSSNLDLQKLKFVLQNYLLYIRVEKKLYLDGIWLFWFFSCCVSIEKSTFYSFP